MVSTCDVCNKNCDNDKQCVKCVECGSSFHIACVKVSSDAVTTRAKKEWTCEKCKGERGKSTSSVSSNKSADSETALTKGFLVNLMESFKKDVFGELKNYGKQLEELKNSQQFFSDSLDTANDTLEEISRKLALLEKENISLKEDNSKLRSANRSLQTRVNSLEQYSRKTNVEISGIPQTKNEDVISIVQDIGKVIGAEVHKEEVMAAHRVPSYIKRRTPQIIVQFQTRVQRNNFLDKYKTARKASNNRMSAKQVNKNFHDTMFFVNEHLTPENKVLLSKTKVTCKEKGFMYTWCKEGKIFVRRADGEPAIRIDCEEDLDKIK